MNKSDIPKTATVSCPIKQFNQRYVVKGCVNCEYFKGVIVLTESKEIEVKDPVTKNVIKKRPILWHEAYMIRCSFPMTRRCLNIEIVEE